MCLLETSVLSDLNINLFMYIFLSKCMFFFHQSELQPFLSIMEMVVIISSGILIIILSMLE